MSAQNGLPFVVEGKTSNPVFRPALGESVKGNLQNGLLEAVKRGLRVMPSPASQKQDLKDALGGLFNKKKKPQQ